MKKRILTTILTICMVITLIPISVGATEVEAGEKTKTETLDISNGSIEITETGYKQGDGEEIGFMIEDGTITVQSADSNKVKYTQGQTELTVDSGEKIVISGRSDNNRIIVESGAPSIILRDIALNGSVSPIELKKGETTLWLEGENSVATYLNEAKGESIPIRVGATAKLIIDSEAGDKVSDPFENVDFSIIDADSPILKSYKGTLTVDSTYGGIAAFEVAAGVNGTSITIQGGNVIATQKMHTLWDIIPALIGHTARNVNVYTGKIGLVEVNITGGNIMLKQEGGGSKVFGLGGNRSKVSIKGGNTAAVLPLSSNGADRGGGIAGNQSEIVIGTSGNTDSEPYVYSEAGMNYPGIGGHVTPVTIHSGTVLSWAGNNGSAIGSGIDMQTGKISIAGGNIGAFNIRGGVAIGIRAHSNSQKYLKSVVEITGGRVTTSGHIGSNVGVGGKSQLADVKVTGDNTVLNSLEKTDTVGGNLTVEDGAKVNFIGRIVGDLTVSNGSDVIAGSVSKDANVDNSKVQVIGDIIGDINASNGSDVIVGCVLKDANVNDATLRVGGNILGDLTVVNKGKYGVAGNVYGISDVANGTKISVHSIAFNNEGSALIHITHRNKGIAIGNDFPENPKRNGYKFVGWNSKYDGSGDVITRNTKVNGKMTAYAQWTKVSQGELDRAKDELSGYTFSIIGDTLSAATLQTAVEEFLKNSDFTKAGGTVNVVYDNKNSRYTANLKLGEREDSVVLKCVAVKEHPESDEEKAIYALKDVNNISIRVKKGTTDTELIQKSYEALKKLVTPYEDTNTTISVIHLHGINYRIIATVGSSSYQREVLVRPEYYSSSGGENGSTGSGDSIDTTGSGGSIDKENISDDVSEVQTGDILGAGLGWILALLCISAGTFIVLSIRLRKQR